MLGKATRQVPTRFWSMDFYAQDETQQKEACSQRFLSVSVPSGNEGIGNALRHAFDPDAEPLPPDFDGLLRQLN